MNYFFLFLMESRSVRNKFRLALSVPFIYWLIVPIILLDISIEIYHQICFRLYKIPLIKRKEYVKIDRHKLNYLDPIEKLNCMYCGYANGLFGYTVKIGGETERFWCGIKHKKDSNFNEPKHHEDFVEHGDKEEFLSRYAK